MRLGAVGSVVLCLAAYGITGNILLAFFGAGLGGLVVGIAIELKQRFDRRGKTQNTLKESVLDIMVTGCWFLWPIR